jgi:integrase
MRQFEMHPTEQSEKLGLVISTILTSFNESDKNNIASDWLKVLIDKLNFPDKYEPKVETRDTTTVFQFIEKFITESPNRKDKRTGRLFLPNIIKQYKAVEKNLKKYAKSVGKTDFEFSDIKQSFYDGFVDFLQKKSLTLNTVGTYVKTLKTFLNEAKRLGYNANSDYSSFHVFSEEIDNVYLNEKELQQLKDTDLSKIPHLALVRDWFLLLAWTGSRFSDLEKISRTDIQEGFITFRQQKTNTKVVIPLHPVVLEILEKYEFNIPAPINNQRFNEYIKEVCEIAELNTKETITRTVGGKLVTKKFEKWEHVGSHTGRRSFCTNMYKRGLPTLMIMSISGHKTESAFLKYIKVKQHEHAEMMKKAYLMSTLMRKQVTWK